MYVHITKSPEYWFHKIYWKDIWFNQYLLILRFQLNSLKWDVVIYMTIDIYSYLRGNY